MEDVVLTEVTESKVGIVTLNRPERRNAVNGPLAAQLDAAVKAMATDSEVKVVVLTGAAPEGGTGGFCSGGDTKRDANDSAGLALGVPPDALAGDLSRHDAHVSMLLHQMPKPTIAMVGGPAVGAGFALAGACDLRFAADDALFCAGFTPNGLSGDYGGSFFWTRIVGTATARRLYLMNERLSAREALALGMVHEVKPATELRSYTLEVAAALARTPREVMALVKDNLNQAEDDGDRRRWLLANEAENQIKAGQAMRERMQRKQPPG
jgi:2-(1,2-epoxy-1,2-dihydrophenyl)acetyl-CoA isomerase